MGVVGSAIAVTISRIVGVTARVLVLYSRKGLKLNMSKLPSFALNNMLWMGLTAVMIGIVLDLSARSLMYLLRMNKGK